jgi:biopolymer transport protein ExbD
MIVRNRHKLVLSTVAILLIAIVLLLWLIASNPIRTESDVAYILIPARESRPMLYHDEGPFSSEDFMIIQQTVNRPAVTEPVSDRQPDSALIEHDCGTLTVNIDGDRNVTLNTDSMGTLNDTSQLATKLSDVFQQRVAHRAYRPGFETRADLPDIQRIPRTVLIRSALSVSYGDVVTLIDLLKELRADPIGLQIKRLPA